jgi:hypothetical protein
VGRPIIEEVMPGRDRRWFDKLMADRKTEVYEFVINALKK